jgi:hypothetical protein
VASLIGAGWRRSTWWLVAGVSAFAVIGIASDLISGRPASVSAANSWVVLTANSETKQPSQFVTRVAIQV